MTSAGDYKPTAAELAEAAAIDELASHLYWKIEHLDPAFDPEFVEWADLEDRDRELWRQGVAYMLRNGARAFAFCCAAYMGLRLSPIEPEENVR